MKINLAVSTSQLVDIQVSPDDTIAVVKEKLKKAYKDLPQDFKLVHNNNQLFDALKVEDYDIDNGTKLTILYEFPLTVITPDMNSESVNVDLSDNFKVVRRKLEKKLGRSFDNCTVSLLDSQGKIVKHLDTRSTLGELGINSTSKVLLHDYLLRVEGFKGELCNFIVNVNDRGKDLKRSVIDQGLGKQDMFEITSPRHIIKDEIPIDVYQVSNSDPLKLVEGFFVYFFRNGKLDKIFYNPKSTVKQLKESLVKEFKTPPYQLREKEKNLILDDDFTLEDYELGGKILEFYVQDVEGILVMPDGSEVLATLNPLDTKKICTKKFARKMKMSKQGFGIVEESKPLNPGEKWRFKYEQNYDISVKTPNGYIFKLFANDQETIKEVKEKLENEIGLRGINLLFNKRPLKDDSTLMACHIRKDSELQIEF